MGLNKYKVGLKKDDMRTDLRINASCFTNAVHKATSNVTYGIYHGWEILYVVRAGYELP